MAMGWADRKTWKLRAIALASGIAGALIALVVARLPLAPAGELDAGDAVSGIAGKLGLMRFLLDIPVISDWAAAHPQITVAAFGFLVIGGAVTAMRRAWLHDAFFASFNDDALVRVADPARPDREGPAARFIELPWTLGPAGPRRAAWDALGVWALDGALERAGLFGRFGAPAAPLTMQVLTGRAGSGKSRMAFEFARSLARRDRLGGGAPKASALWRLTGWMRRVVPPLRARPDDPWDAGLVRRDLAKLKGWTPRRPTILIVDDPGVGVTGKVWALLREASGGYRHPVRLLVANQTVPTDSGLVWGTAPGTGRRAWLRDAATVAHPPVMLAPDAWFTEAETRRIAMPLARKAGRSIAVQAGIERGVRERLFAVTRGNPLLVQLALEWIRDRDSLEDMSAEALSAERAGRILRALEVNGVVDERVRRALALSALLGGVSAVRLRAVLPDIALPDRSTLALCFPTDIGAGLDADLVPAVRPDLVADAFVERVLDETVGADPGALVEDAMRLDAPRLLRALRRPRPQGSKLAAGIAAFQSLPEDARLSLVDPVDWALALADIAAICQPDDRPLSTQESRQEATADAVRALAQLRPDAADRFLAGFASRLDIPEDERRMRQLRPAHAMQIAVAAAEFAPAGSDLAHWTTILRVLEQRSSTQDGLPRFSPDALASLANIAGKSAASRLAFAESLWKLGSHWRTHWGVVWAALAAGPADISDSVAACVLRAMAAIAEPEAVAGIAREACARSDAANAADAVLLARVARFEAYAWSMVPAGAQADRAMAAAETAAAIAARFPDEAGIQLEAATARSYESYAWCQVPGGLGAERARAAAETVASIAALFPDDAGIQNEAATARRMEAYAWSQVPDGRQAERARAAAETVAAVAARFPQDAGIQNEAAKARVFETFAWCQVPDGGQAERARAAAETVAAIAERFPENAAIQDEAAIARRCEAYAWCQVPDGGQAERASAAAETVAAIAARFPQDKGIQIEAARARRMEVYAWSRVPGGAQLDRARAAAAQVAAIAARFPDNAEIQGELRKARSFLPN